MPINFPDSPSNGNTVVLGGKTYTYSTASNSWSPPSGIGLDSTNVINIIDSDYVSLRSSSGGGVTVYANLAAFPSSGNTAGNMGFATNTKAIYVWDGTEWDRIYSDTNGVPEWTTLPPATADLASNGTATTQTVLATDPEGFAIEYSYDTSPSNQAQATISNSGGTFTITPSTVAANAGDFTLRYKATDGLHSTAKSTLYTLGFFPQVASLWGHWDMGNSSSYSGTGTTWSDLSGNSRNLTWTNVGGVAGYKASGNLSIPVWETGTNLSRFTLAVASDVKTILFIFDPIQHPVNDNFVQIFMSAGLNSYVGAFSTSSNVMVGGTNAHSGLTAEYLVNGNSNTSCSAGQAALEQNKFNSFFVKNYNPGGATWTFFQYPQNGYNESMQLKSIAMWTVSLSDSEMQAAHESYAQMATWDG